VHAVQAGEGGGDGECAWPVHRVVDLVAGLGKGALQARWPGIEPADVPAVEAEDGRLVLGAGGEPRLLVLPDRTAYPLRLGGKQFLAVSHPPRHAGRASAKDHALQRRAAGPPAPPCPPSPPPAPPHVPET